jgi:hypothetical protein
MGFDEWLDAEALFEQGAQHRWREGDVSTLGVVEVCHLELATGQVVAVDPAYFGSFDEAWPVVAQVPPGIYPCCCPSLHCPPPGGLTSLAVL